MPTSAINYFEKIIIDFLRKGRRNFYNERELTDLLTDDRDLKSLKYIYLSIESSVYVCEKCAHLHPFHKKRYFCFISFI